MAMLFYIIKSRDGCTILKGDDDKLKIEAVKPSHEVIGEVKTVLDRPLRISQNP